MLDVKNLYKKFGKKTAVDNISFNLNSGEIIGFLGPNGAGKTTTIKMIVGLLSIDDGSIDFDGIDIATNSYEAKKHLSYVPDNPDIFDNMTGISYINFLADVYGVSKEDRKKRIQEYAEYFEMTEALSSPISSYSHGMKQKICLIGSLIHDPKLLILDEPMVGLDPKSAFNLKKLMRKRADEGKTIFFSTHVMEVAEKVCDRVIIISKGKIITENTIEGLKIQAGEDKSLESLFLELTEWKTSSY